MSIDIRVRFSVECNRRAGHVHVYTVYWRSNGGVVYTTTIRLFYLL